MTLARALGQLVGRLDNKPLLDHLYSREVITEDNYQTLLRLDNKHEQSRDILSLLSREGSTAFDCFAAFFLHNEHLYGGLYKTLMDLHESCTEGRTNSIRRLICKFNVNE